MVRLRTGIAVVVLAVFLAAAFSAASAFLAVPVASAGLRFFRLCESCGFAVLALLVVLRFAVLTVFTAFTLLYAFVLFRRSPIYCGG